MPPEGLPERVGGDELAELGDEPPVPAQLEVGGDPSLDGFETPRLEAGGLQLGEVVVLQAGQGRAPPLAEGGGELLGGQDMGAAALAGETGVELVLEAGRVDRGSFDGEHVPGAARLDLGSGPEVLAQPREVRPHRLRRRAGRRLAPQLVGHAVDRDDPVGIDDEQRQQRLLLAATDRHRPVFTHDLGEPEDPEVHRPSVRRPGSRHRAPHRLSRHTAAASDFVGVPVMELRPSSTS